MKKNIQPIKKLLRKKFYFASFYFYPKLVSKKGNHYPMSPKKNKKTIHFFSKSIKMINRNLIRWDLVMFDHKIFRNI